MLFAMKHIGKLAQAFQKDITVCIETTGQDVSGPDSCHLRSLIDQYICLHTVQARANSASHKALINSPVTHASATTASMDSAPDYSYLGVRYFLNACMLTLITAKRICLVSTTVLGHTSALPVTALQAPHIAARVLAAQMTCD